MPSSSLSTSATATGNRIVEVTVAERQQQQQLQVLGDDATYCIRCATTPTDGNGNIGCRYPDVADAVVDDDGSGRCDRRRRANSTSSTFGGGPLLQQSAVTGLMPRPGSSCTAAYGGGHDGFFELECSSIAGGLSADIIDAGPYAGGRPAVTGSGGLLCRLAASVFVGQLIGAALFIWMFCHLDYGLTASAAAGSASAVTVCLLSAASRLCRAIGALTLPSLGTGEGRLAFVIIAVGALLAGPVSNVYVNMEEVSRAMGCSAEQSYNQTMFLLQPFDAMMTQLNWTIGGLQDAAANIGRGLKPLEDGLGTVEMYLDNGKLQLFGTRKVQCHSRRSLRYSF